MHKRGRLPLLDYFSAWLDFLDLCVDIHILLLVTLGVFWTVFGTVVALAM